MNRRPNPAIPADARCSACLGWGGHIIHPGADDREDTHECLSCHGSGRQTTKHEIRRHNDE